jgi:hypothetical protein
MKPEFESEGKPEENLSEKPEFESEGKPEENLKYET